MSDGRCKQCARDRGKKAYYALSVEERVAKGRTRRGNRKYLDKANEYKRANRERLLKQHAEWKKRNRANQTAEEVHRYAVKMRAVPAWADKDAMELIYKKAREYGFQVDHIVPLQSRIVSGLHCEDNMQLLDKQLNTSKNNKFWPDMPGEL